MAGGAAGGAAGRQAAGDLTDGARAAKVSQENKFTSSNYNTMKLSVAETAVIVDSELIQRLRPPPLRGWGLRVVHNNSHYLVALTPQTAAAAGRTMVVEEHKESKSSESQKMQDQQAMTPLTSLDTTERVQMSSLSPAVRRPSFVIHSTLIYSDNVLFHVCCFGVSDSRYARLCQHI